MRSRLPSITRHFLLSREDMTVVDSSRLQFLRLLVERLGRQTIGNRTLRNNRVGPMSGAVTKEMDLQLRCSFREPHFGELQTGQQTILLLFWPTFEPHRQHLMSNRAHPSKSSPTGMEIYTTSAFQNTRVRVLRTRLYPAWGPQDEGSLLSKSKKRRNGAMTNRRVILLRPLHGLQGRGMTQGL
jgi:hypothetical protein